MKNITLSVDEQTLQRAREGARKKGKSLNAIIRDFLAELGGTRKGDLALKKLERLWAKGRGRSGGEKFDRESLYAGRT